MPINRRHFLEAGALLATGSLLGASRSSAEPPVVPPPGSPLPPLPTPPSPETDQRFFPGFTREAVQTSGATINVLRGGKGAPLLLIHGHP